MTDLSASQQPAAVDDPGWLGRHPLFVSFFAAAAFLGIFQALFIFPRLPPMGGWPMALGMAKLGAMSGFATLLVLLPAILILRRLHAAWRAGDRRVASWAACFAPALAIGAWMIADVLTSSALVPPSLGAAIEVVVATTVFALVFFGHWLWPPPSRLRLVTAAALGTLLAAVFAPVPGAPKAPAAEPLPASAVSPDAELPDVVLVVVDTLRADRLGVYGRSPSISPALDRIAAEGVVFEQALAASPWTVPSVASMLTGLPSTRHGSGLPLGSGPTFLRTPLEPEFTTLAERFKAAGYRTRAVVANGFLTPQAGFAQGFDQFTNPFNNSMISAFLRDLPLARLVLALVPPERLGDYRAQGVTDRALAWLEEDDAAPLFLWVHYIDPHTPYQKDPGRLDPEALQRMIDQQHPEALEDGTVIGDVFVATDLVRGGTLWLGPDDRRRLEEYYDRAVSYVDEQIDRLFAELRLRSERRPVIAAVTSDHGEEFWEHGHFEHGHDYYQEVTRIPLLFWGPGVVPANRSVADLGGLVDVGPTLLELANLEPTVPAAMDEGRSLAATWVPAGAPAGADAGEGARAQAPPRFSEGNLYGLPAVLIGDGRWRFLLRANGRRELYDLIEDPGEERDRSADLPERAAAYHDLARPRLEVFLSQGTGDSSVEIAPEQLRALRALGYLE